MNPTDTVNECVQSSAWRADFRARKTLDELLANLCDGVDPVSFFQDEEVRVAARWQPPDDRPN